ncbi:hypothetical protein MCOR27_005775 [Pyricularia oryzae]|uniref:Xaa-Pro dipeptidyl-peptidase C-terminal domain-containing protein n=1 Tax=Pyricularia grisea TaxID=148305 RepID=A0ABQ8NZH8_PYRGI|nr:hypothetical protein MCOR01_009728 [Pyricularia oryzae]KAI6304311.1 hypothetical protein MCOR33_000622 [Pyricularia grisea]KAH9436984.1 hypothetical protein MCOR02_000646 [Pyricularia oryzae]KAI6260032.1 hypothetical protein MCOR19_003648 [Pyricularia oryzae]KAI6278023.1 hypothetical protein MCOR27_005775 [Pyricularia oryzae]
MVDILKRACAPLKGPATPPSNTILPKGHRRQPNSRTLPVPISFDHNQPFSMRDGVTIRADIYRPTDSGPVPAIIIWGPYGKSGSGPLNLASFPLRCGIPESALSGYESFEGLDPAEWVGRGYAIVNADARGSGDSEGDIRWWGRGEGEDGHDLVEAIASQPWCSGRVAFAGNSWLAIAQWFIASQRPPHLTCIAPLEGTSDLHQEQLCRGGIPDVGFAGLIAHSLPGRQQQEDVVAMLEKHPNYNEYWQDKRADIGLIQVPAYIGASYSSNLHTLGSFRGFEEIPHEKKWLVVHDTQEWYDLYSRERTEDLARFFDFYMKDAKNGWEETPTVRISLLGFNVPNEVQSLPHLPWRASGAKRTKLYLDADQSLSPTAPRSAEPAVLAYQADAPTRQTGDDPGELAFKYTFPTRTTLAGPSTLVVHVASEQQDDLDVWAQLRKAGADGALLQSLNIPLGKLGLSSPAEVPDVCTLKHLGPIGMLRASSTARAKPTGPGDVVRLEIPIEQGGMVFEAGEKLVLKLAGHEMRLVDLLLLQGAFKTTNRGKHFVHFQADRPNYLEVFVQ